MDYYISIVCGGGDDPKLPGDGICKAFTLSYVDAQGKVYSVVSADSEVEVSNMSLLGCSAASAALRAVEIATGAQDKDSSVESSQSPESCSKRSVSNSAVKTNVPSSIVTMQK